MELLLDKGADINSRDNGGVSPLLFAVGRRDSATVQLLARRGADLEVESKQNKMTPLLLAIETGQRDSVAYLLDKGAQVNGKNSDGLTPLMSASEKGDSKLVKLLLEHGADPGAEDNLGRTAAARAEQHGQQAILEMLARALSESALDSSSDK